MKSPSLAFLLCVLTAPVWAGAVRDNAERLADFQGVAFGVVKAASVATLGEHGNAAFHGLKMTSDWIKVGAIAQAGLAALFRERIDRWIRASVETKGDDILEGEPFWVPDYGDAMRLETDKGVRDFAIGLRCGQVVAYGCKKQGVAFLLKNEALAELNTCYRDEFGPARGAAKKP